MGLYQGIADVRGQPARLCEVRFSGLGSSGSEHCAPVAHNRREDLSLGPSPSRPLSQPVVSGVVSTAGPESAQLGSDDQAHGQLAHVQIIQLDFKRFLTDA